MNSKVFDFNQVRGIGDKIELSFDFWKSNFKTIFSAALSLCIPFYIMGSVIQTASEIFISEGDGTFVRLFGTLLILIGNTFLTSMAFGLVKVYIDPNVEFNVNNIKEVSKKYSGKIFGALILYGFMVGLATLFFVIPGIFIMISWSFIMPVIIFEDKSIGEAISKSSKLIKNKWWNTFFYNVVLYLIFGIVSIVFNLLPTIPAMLGDTLIMQDMSSTLKIVSMFFALANGVVSPIIATLLHIGICTNYLSIKEEKEATSVLKELEAL